MADDPTNTRNLNLDIIDIEEQVFGDWQRTFRLMFNDTLKKVDAAMPFATGGLALDAGSVNLAAGLTTFSVNLTTISFLTANVVASSQDAGAPAYLTTDKSGNEARLYAWDDAGAASTVSTLSANWIAIGTA